jgi:RNA polymerase-binding transcription factor DksA
MSSKGKPIKSAKPAAAAKKASPAKPAPAKKPAPKSAAKPAAKKSAPKPAPTKPAAKAVAPKTKELVKKKPAAAVEAKSTSVRRTNAKAEPVKAPAKPAPAPAKPAPISDIAEEGEIKHSVFVKIAKQKLLDLKDSLMDTMTGTASETLRNKAEGSEASAFGMHQADAGTDAYDRDFALSLLAQEQDSLYEIEEALKRITAGTYGICEMSGKRIPQARLEALPFARFTIESQQQYEKEVGPNSGRRQVRSLFGLMGSEDEDEEGDEDSNEKDKDKDND